MQHLLLFGPGYTASRVADALKARGNWRITRIGRAEIEDQSAVEASLVTASHIFSSIPPHGDEDPVLTRYVRAISNSRATWVGYLSSTGVYGDSGGAWVDESSPVAGRRSARNAADARWSACHPEARVFRLPGIYGPGRSALDRVLAGNAHRVDLPDQLFSRVHIDDIVSGVLASIDDGPAGVYNLADDLPAPQNDVITFAATLLGLEIPPLQSVADARLSPQALAFYAENRRVANGKAKRLLGWAPRYPTFREGLASLLSGSAARPRMATIIPASARLAPAMDSSDQL